MRIQEDQIPNFSFLRKMDKNKFLYLWLLWSKPNLGSRTYRQHSALIPSVVTSAFKGRDPVLTVLVPGSIASTHSLSCNIK